MNVFAPSISSFRRARFFFLLTGVSLSLSTAEPTVRKTPPILGIQTLTFKPKKPTVTKVLCLFLLHSMTSFSCSLNVE